MKVCAWYIDSNGIGNKHTVKYPYCTGIKTWEFLIIGTWMASKKDDTRPTLIINPFQSFTFLIKSNIHQLIPTEHCFWCVNIGATSRSPWVDDDWHSQPKSVCKLPTTSRCSIWSSFNFGRTRATGLLLFSLSIQSFGPYIGLLIKSFHNNLTRFLPPCFCTW